MIGRAPWRGLTSTGDDRVLRIDLGGLRLHPDAFLDQVEAGPGRAPWSVGLAGEH
ncbi:MAG: hypothetical protein ABIS35_13865 [Terracoccus sp.]